jgi:hypothetical protein
VWYIGLWELVPCETFVRGIYRVRSELNELPDVNDVATACEQCSCLSEQRRGFETQVWGNLFVGKQAEK